MRVAIFIIIFAVVFAAATSQHDDGDLIVGTPTGSSIYGWPRHLAFSYGWPQYWLFVNKEIYQDGSRHEIGKNLSSWEIGWQPLLVSVGVVAAIAAALSSPLLFLHRFKRHHEPVA